MYLLNYPVEQIAVYPLAATHAFTKRRLTQLSFLKALVFLYAFEASVDCHLLSSFCDDSNLRMSLFKCVLSTMGVSKESISKFLMGN